MEALLTQVNDALWIPLAFMALATGTFFTVMTRGVQFRRIPDTLRDIFSKRSDTEGISSFQALMLTLANRVGVGNIAGVATAIFAGGPGALFWMVATALVVSCSAFAETVLGQVFKRRIDNEHRGGPPFYIEHGLNARWLAVIVATMFLLAYVVFLPGIQANSISVAIEGAFSVPTWVTAVVLTAVMAFVVLGGTKRIVRAVELLVPVFAVGYLLLALIIIGFNVDQIIPTMQLVVSSAFGADSVFGGMLGAAIAWGVRRSLYSNIAGVGEGAFGSSAAAVSHPVKQGLVQSFSTFIDTVLISHATGIMIILTMSYNVQGADGATLVENLPGVEAGALYTQEAVDTVLPGFGAGFVAIALFFFAFSTLIAYSYLAATNLSYLRGTATGPIYWVCMVLLLVFTFSGSVSTANTVWALGDFAYAVIGWIHMVVLLLLSPTILKVLKDYDRQRKAGLDPTFDPVPLGIKNADFWTDHSDERQSEKRQKMPD